MSRLKTYHFSNIRFIYFQLNAEFLHRKMIRIAEWFARSQKGALLGFHRPGRFGRRGWLGLF
jgi:hypothetical protein